MGQDFFDLARTARVAQADPVTGLPGAQNGRAGSGLRAGKLDAQTQTEGRSGHFPGYGKVVHGSRFRGSTEFCRHRGRQTQLAGRALHAQASGEFKLLAGVTGEREGAHGFCGGEVRLCAEPAGGVAQKAALVGDAEGGETSAVEGHAFAGGAAPTADGFAGQDQLRGEAGEVRLPECFFIAGKTGHVCEVWAELGVPRFEKREQFTADAVAGEGEIAVRGVLAPGLVEGAKIGFDLRTGDGEERSDDGADTPWAFEFWTDSCQAFGPRAAQEFGEHGFGLVVEGVRGYDCVERDFGQERGEPYV